jgi:hypothetical protein
MNSNASRPGGDTFPCASPAEALPRLRPPPSPAAVHFKVQNPGGQAAQVAAYIDARRVFDRLDQVCGNHWSAPLRRVAGGADPAARRPQRPGQGGAALLRPCRLTVYGVTREDVGEGQDPKGAPNLRRPAGWRVDRGGLPDEVKVRAGGDLGTAVLGIRLRLGTANHRRAAPRSRVAGTATSRRALFRTWPYQWHGAMAVVTIHALRSDGASAGLAQTGPGTASSRC